MAAGAAVGAATVAFAANAPTTAPAATVATATVVVTAALPRRRRMRQWRTKWRRRRWQRRRRRDGSGGGGDGGGGEGGGDGGGDGGDGDRGGGGDGGGALGESSEAGAHVTFATQPASVVISEPAHAAQRRGVAAVDAAVVGGERGARPPAPASGDGARGGDGYHPVQSKVVVPRGLQRDGERGTGGAYARSRAADQRVVAAPRRHAARGGHSSRSSAAGAPRRCTPAPKPRPPRRRGDHPPPTSEPAAGRRAATRAPAAAPPDCRGEARVEDLRRAPAAARAARGRRQGSARRAEMWPKGEPSTEIPSRRPAHPANREFYHQDGPTWPPLVAEADRASERHKSGCSAASRTSGRRAAARATCCATRARRVRKTTPPPPPPPARRAVRRWPRRSRAAGVAGERRRRGADSVGELAGKRKRGSTSPTYAARASPTSPPGGRGDLDQRPPEEAASCMRRAAAADERGLPDRRGGAAAAAARPAAAGGARVSFTPAEVEQLCAKAQAIVEGQPPLIRLSAPVKIFGDLHGQYGDLMRLFEQFGQPSREGGDIDLVDYLFLGDYVDRGKHSLETVVLLLALKCLHPDRVFLIRGNHESPEVNARGNFLHGYVERFGDRKKGVAGRRLNQLFDGCRSPPGQRRHPLRPRRDRRAPRVDRRGRRPPAPAADGRPRRRPAPRPAVVRPTERTR